MWDLVTCTLDDATSEVYLGLFRRRGRHYERFQALSEVIAQRPVLHRSSRSGGALKRRRPAARSRQSDPGGPRASHARHRADQGHSPGGAQGQEGMFWSMFTQALAPGAAPAIVTARRRPSSGSPAHNGGLRGLLRRRACLRGLFPFLGKSFAPTAPGQATTRSFTAPWPDPARSATAITRQGKDADRISRRPSSSRPRCLARWSKLRKTHRRAA